MYSKDPVRDLVREIGHHVVVLLGLRLRELDLTHLVLVGQPVEVNLVVEELAIPDRVVDAIWVLLDDVLVFTILVHAGQVRRRPSDAVGHAQLVQSIRDFCYGVDVEDVPQHGVVEDREDAVGIVIGAVGQTVEDLVVVGILNPELHCRALDIRQVPAHARDP